MDHKSHVGVTKSLTCILPAVQSSTHANVRHDRSAVVLTATRPTFAVWTNTVFKTQLQQFVYEVQGLSAVQVPQRPLQPEQKATACQETPKGIRMEFALPKVTHAKHCDCMCKPDFQKSKKVPQQTQVVWLHQANKGCYQANIQTGSHQRQSDGPTSQARIFPKLVISPTKGNMQGRQGASPVSSFA